MSLDSHRAIEEVLGNSDLEGFEDDSQTIGNGTVTKSPKKTATDEVIDDDQGQNKETNEQLMKL